MTRLVPIVLLATLAFACGGKKEEEAVQHEAAAAVPGVETAVAAIQPVRDTLQAFGAVAPGGEPPEVRDARAELAQAEARRALAAQQVRRLEALAQGAVAPRKELDAARAEEAAAAAAAARARQVLETFGSPDEYRPLAPDEAGVVARVLQRDVPRVEGGAPAQLLADAAPGQPFAGHVDGAPAYVDPVTHLGTVRVLVHDPAHQLRPGMTGAVAIEVGAPRPAVVVPLAAVVLDGAQTFVFVEESGGHFTAHAVRTGVTHAGMIEITDDLPAGTRVATTGAASLLSATRLPAGGAD